MDQMTSFSKSLQNVHNDIEPELSSVRETQPPPIPSQMRNAAEERRDETPQTLHPTRQTLILLPSQMRNAAEECRDATEACSKDTSRLKNWTETGFRRLNDAMTVQQQAYVTLNTKL